jgi:hypothetical protein
MMLNGVGGVVRVDLWREPPTGQGDQPTGPRMSENAIRSDFVGSVPKVRVTHKAEG